MLLIFISAETMNMIVIDDQSSSDEEDVKEATIESPTVESPTEEDFNQRRSVQLKKYSNSISEEWDMSKEKIRKSLHLSPETDLTGPDYGEDQELITKNSSDELNTASTGGAIKKKISSNKTPTLRQTSINSSAPPKTPTKTTKKETAIFYTRVDTDQAAPASSNTSAVNEQWKLEDLEVPDETSINQTSHQIINGPPSPTDTKPKLWSCFPAIKSGSKRNSYKNVMQSPPYMPVSRENTSRYNFCCCFFCLHFLYFF